MPKHCHLPFSLVAAALLCAGRLSLPAAAPHFTVDHFGVAHGLAQSVVFALTQTRDGYLWIGTPQGLARFDGVQVTLFDENNTPGLTSGQVTRLFEDSRSNLWIGTAAGVVLADNSGKLVSLDEDPGALRGRLMAACEDKSGAVWLYRADGRLERYRDGKRTAAAVVGWQGPSNYRALVEDSSTLWAGTDLTLSSLDLSASGTSDKIPPAGEIVGRIKFLLPSRTGGYWLLANGRIQKYKAGRLDREFGSFPWSNDPTNSLPIFAACEDADGNLIVGTYGEGVYWFDAEGKATRISKTEGLAHDSVLALAVDRDGCLWVGSNGGGLDRVKREVFSVLEGTRGAVVQSVAEDAQGGLWIGYTGNKIDYWNGGVTRHFGLLREGLLDVRSEALLDVKSVFVGRNEGALGGNWVLAGAWFARGPNVFQMQGGRFQPLTNAPNRDVSAIFQDHAGRVWLGLRGGLLRLDEHGITLLTARDGLSAEDVRAIAEDPEGNLWLGTQGGGLNVLRDGRFTCLAQTNGLPGNNISSLYVDAQGVLWVGASGGLARFKAGKWTRYSLKEGLAANNIGYLIEDSQGSLWLGSTAGLMRVKKKALNDFADGKITSVPCRLYGEPDGLPASECTSGSQPGACRTRDGRLWFPSIHGLAFLDPARLNVNTNQPPVVIEGVLVDGQLQHTNGLRTPPPQTVTIPAGKETIEIEYRRLNLGAPEKGRFRYRMEGYETAWTTADGRIRTAHYPKLPPGHYRFHVIACNEDEVWNETGAVLATTVLPAFWQTWWFIALTTLGLLGMIIGLVHYVSTQKLQRQVERLRHQQALEKERARIARDIHDQVGASLTQVSLLGELVESDKDNPHEVEAHARQISQTALETTRALDEIVWTVNPSNDTLDGLINYICKYAQEYLALAGLRYRLEIPSNLAGIPISPELRHNVFLAAKEAVNNVVKHAQASSVWLRLRPGPDRFVLEIEDDGRGLAPADEQKGRNGLRNMRKRMEDIGGEFAFGPGAEGGTRVRLTVPLRRAILTSDGH